MESTQNHIDKLLSELQESIQSLITLGEPRFDWSEWIRIVESLKIHLQTQVETCHDKFNPDVYSVGSFASNQQVLDSLQQVKRRLAE